MKQKRLYRYIGIFVLILMAAFAVPAVAAYAKDCPGEEQWSTYTTYSEWYTGCYTCGGTWKNTSDPTGYERIFDRDNAPQLANPDLELRGVQTKKMVSDNDKYDYMIVYYRCKNCGVCMEYSREVGREYYKEGIAEPQKTGGSKTTEGTWVGAGSGFVPWWVCTVTGCGVEAYEPANRRAINHVHFPDTVSFDSNGSPDIFTPIETMYGEAYGTLPAPTWTGYTFLGWYYNGSKVTSTTVQKVNKDHTLTAKWEADIPSPTPTPAITEGPVISGPPEAKKVTVTFDPDGGYVSPASKQVVCGSKYGLLPTPSKGGLAFLYWSYAGRKITSDTIVSAETDHTLTAVYATPAPSPTVTPTPIPTPMEDKYWERERYHYYSTDKGYTLDAVANDSNNSLAKVVDEFGNKAGYSGDRITAAEQTKRSSSYRKGTDSSGNSWYFIASGTDATYVHPAVYNGYDACTEQVQYITELTFPSFITYNGTSYTVVSVGGGGATYHSSGSDTDKSDYITYNYGPEYGKYSYFESSGNIDMSMSVSYRYGVLGNGFITSNSYYSTYYSSEDVSQDYNGANSYYVYNTTLKKVVLPSTVKTVLQGAFMYCQALESVTCSSATQICEDAFSAATITVSTVSKPTSTSYYDSIGCLVHENVLYYYNDSYSTSAKTATMLAWEAAVPLAGYMNLAALTSVQTIEEYAFHNRSNMYHVALGTGITSIGTNAFSGCKLDRITIPGGAATVVDNTDISSTKEQTLGTKGKVTNPTVIRTNLSAAKVLDYGNVWTGYYVMEAGYTVTYNPNGGTRADTGKNEAVTFFADAESKAPEIASWSGDLYLDNAGQIWTKKEQNGNMFLQMIYSGSTAFTKVEQNKYRKYYQYTDSGSFVRELTDYYYYLTGSDGNIYLTYYQPGDEYGIYTPKKLGTYAPSSCYDYRYNFSSSYTYGYQRTSSATYLYLYNVTASDGEWLVTDTSKKTASYALDDYDYVVQNSSGQYPKVSVSNSSVVLKPTSSTSISYKNTGKTFTEATCFYGKTYQVNTGTSYTSVTATDHYVIALASDGTSELITFTETTTKSTPPTGGAPTSSYITSSKGTTLSVAFDGSTFIDISHFSGFEYKALMQNTSGAWYGITDVPTMAFKALSWSSLPGIQKVYYDGAGGIIILDTNGHLWSTGTNASWQLGNSSGALATTSIKKVCGAAVFTDVMCSPQATFALTDTGALYAAGKKGYYGLEADYTTFRPHALYSGKTVQFSGDMAYIFADSEYTVSATGKAFPSIGNGYRCAATIKEGTIVERSGHTFLDWNTKADGTGTTYAPGTTLYLTSNLAVYARWKTDSQITYLPNGGSGTMEPSLPAAGSNTITVAANRFTAPAGHTFFAWNTKADGTGSWYSPGSTVEVAGSLPLYARWAPISYTVQFGKTEYEISTEISVSRPVDYGVSFNVAAQSAKIIKLFYNRNNTNMSTTPVMSGTSREYDQATLSFLGWKLYKETASGYTRVNTTMYANSQSVKNLTTVAGDVFTFFPDWNGSGSVTLPTMTCTGYTFKGWAETEEETDYSKAKTGTYTFTSDKTVYAMWQAKTYAITLDGQGAATHPKTSVTMTFDKTGPDLDSETELPTKPGYLFDGYYTKINGGGDQYYDENGQCIKTWTIADGSVKTLYAKWNPVDYSMYLNPNTGYFLESDNSKFTGMKHVPVTYGTGDGTDLSDYMPYKTGYSFFGWWIKPGGDVKVHDADGKAVGDGTYFKDGKFIYQDGFTLFAGWTPNMYKITLDYSGGVKGSGDSSPYTVTYNSGNYNDISWGLPTRVGHTFTGWYTAKTGGTQVYDASGVCTNDGTYWKGSKWVYPDNVTLYAQWEPITYTNSLYHTLFGFKNGEGKNYPWSNTGFLLLHEAYSGVYGTEQTFNSDNFVQVPNGCYVNYYTSTNLSGVSTNYGHSMNFIQPERNVVIALYYGAKTYSITYELNGGTNAANNPASYNVLYGASLENPTRLGYTFSGWYTDASFSEESKVTGINEGCDAEFADAEELYAELAKRTTGNLTLYAKWTPKTYEITLNDRGATSKGVSEDAVNGHTENVTMIFDAQGPPVRVPSKTGYTFEGYYTETRGNGTRYYDANGKSVKTWTEDTAGTLYAYWKQIPVVLPEEDEYIEPDVEEETTIEGSIGRTDAKGLLYADDYNDATGALNDMQPYLTYDTPVTEGVIPGTENLSFRAKVGSWMLNYKLHMNTGKDYVKIIVTIPYRTQYEVSATEELVISERKTKDYSFLVPKTWSYWEVVQSAMYYPDSVTVTNSILENGGITVPVDRTGTSSIEVPDYAVTNYGTKDEHIRWPSYDSDGIPMLTIVLTEEQYIISNKPDTLPDADRHNKIVCKNAAWADDREAEVRSDRYEFNGSVLLSDEWQTGNGASLDNTKLPANAETVEFTSYLQTYQSCIALDVLKPNGRYETMAVITYVGDASNIGADATKEVTLNDINDLNIHTPVACDGVIMEGIEYVAEEDGTERAVLTLKDALNFFTLRIDNTGTHRMSLGYGCKDFKTALSGKSNVAVADGSLQNQVQFPFDVYVDVGNDSLKEDGSYDTAGDLLLEAGEWYTTGVELCKFFVPATIKNGEYTVKFRSIAVNCPKDAYGQYQVENLGEAEANVNPENYVATDSLKMEIVSYLRDFRITATEDPRAAEKLAAGCQAVTLKKGYGFSYRLFSQGEFYSETVELQVTPKFFWESEDGLQRQEVIPYRADEFLSGVNRECYAWDTEPLLLQQENYDVILQEFSGNGMIPSDVLCVSKEMAESFEAYAKIQTFTGTEEFFKRNGYLVIQFEIKVKSNTGKWYIFDRWSRTELAEDAIKEGWNYVTGDVIRYDLSKSIEDDYEIGGRE